MIFTIGGQKMLDVAQKYYELGFCVVPANSKKRPTIKWKELQNERIVPNGNFLYATHLGIITGKISGGLEVMDFDLKYDLTGKLFDKFKQTVVDHDPKLLEKMVVQKSQNGGYHFFYLCDEIEGNQPLARREASVQEVFDTPDEKVKVLIETRGEGGFIMTYPSDGYEWFYKDLSEIKRITPQERSLLFACAKTFNEVFEKPVVQKEYTENNTVFDKWNQTGDIESVLEEHGWTYKGNCNGNRMYLRPNGTQEWSAGYHPETKLFRVFTTSTQFTNNTTYNPSQVLAYLKFDKNMSATAKWLESNGYGNKKSDAEFKIEDESTFLPSQTEEDNYIDQLRSGTFQMGLTTGHKSLDKHWLLKPNHLVMNLGHDNVGKSVFAWYIAQQSAKFHDWKWIIWSGENMVGGVKKKIIEFYNRKKIEDLSEKELAASKDWFKQHFTLINNDNIYTYSDMLTMGRKLLEKGKYNCFMIDPYNGLYKQSDNEHQYDYKAMLEFRLFIKQTGCGIWLNVHAITEALRRKYPKGHIFENHPMPPHKADAEGGGKFPNKADDFIISHRMTQHKDRWMLMEVHVNKIKEAESGGKQTNLDEPVLLKMMRGSVGYEEVEAETPFHLRDFSEPQRALESSDEEPF